MDSADTSVQGFNEQGVYPCPACRLGQIQALSLMDAMACNTCRHIFTANLQRQWLLMVDRSPPLVWHWNGRNWTGAHVEGVKLGWRYWLSAVAFVLLPPTLIGVSAYALVTASGASPPLLSIVWTGLTFLLHLALIGRSIIGFYRFPVRTYFSTVGRNLFSR
ncbi:MAG: hypothetical protein HC769_22465 [Cyanobacteria bacterium CRU_2_1]|nr:hypothetical protein [Cyanobacteria bacterium RU_5_0]NJR61352.1 hypothetical protein [Cyanobacteria bacterium CRU_2_1]